MTMTSSRCAAFVVQFTLSVVSWIFNVKLDAKHSQIQTLLSKQQKIF